MTPEGTDAIGAYVLSCERCVATIAPSSDGRYSRWIKQRAHNAGWYFQRDGRVFCPAHRPQYAPQREEAS